MSVENLNIRTSRGSKRLLTELYVLNRPVNITGEPPNLTLNLDLKAVIQNDEGRWRLELANEIGVGHLDFEVVITDGKGIIYFWTLWLFSLCLPCLFDVRLRRLSIPIVVCYCFPVFRLIGQYIFSRSVHSK